MSKSTLTYEQLLEIDLNKLTLEKRLKVQQLTKELYERKMKYPIMDYTPLPHQQRILNSIQERAPQSKYPKYKFVMFIGGNGSGKTNGSVYIDILMALGKDTEKYGLPYIGEAKQILIVTKTSDVIKTNLEPYFLGTDSLKDTIKIPKQEIKKVHRDNSTKSLKQIDLHNGCVILFRTYDAGQSRLEGSSPDFIHLDELPEREDIFLELLRGTRKNNAQMLLSFTPTKFNPAVYNYFYGQESEDVINMTFIEEVDSLQNTHVNHTWLMGLSEDEQKIRRYGMFIPPTGLVYNAFSKERNVIPHISPRELGHGTRYYAGLDFGVSHPMAYLAISVDEEGHIYVFEEIYQKRMLLSDLAQAIKDLNRHYSIATEYIVADTADARARMELKQVHGVDTVPADKWSKGETNLSNRRAGIFKINELFSNGTLYISENCVKLIQELLMHAYKGNGSEDVIKENDDAIDALRYFIFSYTRPDKKREYKRAIKRIGAKKKKNIIRY